MDPFTLALLGSSAASGLGSVLGARASGQASQAQSQAAMLSALIQAQQAEQARQDILRGQGQAAQALTGAQAPTLEALRTSSQQAQDLLRGGTTAASGELRAAREAAIRPLIQAQRAQQRALGGTFGMQAGYQQPYLSTGAGAQNQLAALYGVGGDVNAPGYGAAMRQPTLEELQMDPGYAFRMAEGQRALQSTLGSSGMRGSGAALKAATRYGQEAGSQEYQNAYARFMANRQAALSGLQGLAGSGQSAANVMSQAAGGLGANLANIYGTTGQNVSNIQSATGQNLANLQAQQGANLAANVLGTGQNVANVYSGTGTNLANVYTGTAPQLANISLGTGQALGTGLENAAQARASGYMGGATALSQALGNVGQNALAYSMMDRMYGQARPAMAQPFNRNYGMGYGPQL